MFVHAFGAYFGLAVARVIYTKEVKDNNNESSSYHADLFSMIGTIFLWLYWPSFNSATAVGDDQHRAVVNTYLALCASCVSTFAFSAILNKDGKFEMVSFYFVRQNAISCTNNMISDLTALCACPVA